jgi:hypothetical protein
MAGNPNRDPVADHLARSGQRCDVPDRLWVVAVRRANSTLTERLLRA